MQIEWAPYIARSHLPTTIINRRSTFQVQVRDNSTLQNVWAVVYPPDYVPPASDGEINTDSALDRILLVPQPAQGPEIYEGSYPGFSQLGVYRIVVHAADEDGLLAQPAMFKVDTHHLVFFAHYQPVDDKMAK